MYVYMWMYIYIHIYIYIYIYTYNCKAMRVRVDAKRATGDEVYHPSHPNPESFQGYNESFQC